MTTVHPTASSRTSETPDPSDAELCTLLRSGSHAALGTIIARHRRVVYWTAFTVTGSHPDTEEVTADAFLTLWDKRLRFTLAGEFLAPWLATTARFLAKNRLRSTQRRLTQPLSDAARLEQPDIEEPVDIRVALDAAVSLLPDVDAAIFRLCLEEELSYDEAARALGLTEGSVRNRLSRLRRKLQDALRPTLTERSDS